MALNLDEYRSSDKMNLGIALHFIPRLVIFSVGEREESA